MRAAVLASACPGWVCYAEKSHPKTLPHISRIKSPQGIMGTLVKRHLAESLGVTPAQVLAFLLLLLMLLLLLRRSFGRRGLDGTIHSTMLVASFCRCTM